MNFEDEDYIRVYVRDTATTKKLGWEGRTVLWHLGRIVPKSGVLELEEGDDVVEVVAALCDLPEDITKLGLERLTSRGVTVHHAASIEIVRFVEAQNAKRSDRLRAQDYRDRQKAEALASVEKKASASQRVTARHDSSLPASPPLSLPPPATPGPATPIAAVVEDPDRDSGFQPCAAAAPGIPVDPIGVPRPPVNRHLATMAEKMIRSRGAYMEIFGDTPSWPELQPIFLAFQETWGRNGAPTHGGDPRAMLILQRIVEGISVDRLALAVRRSKFASYIVADESYQTLTTILRDAAQVDKFCALTALPRKAGLSREPQAEGGDWKPPVEKRS